MLLDFCGSERHRPSNVCNLQPRACKTLRRRTLRQHTRGALLHYLRYKLVRIEQRTRYSDKQRTVTNTPRIMTYIRDDPRSIAAELRARYFGESFNICHGFTTTAGIF